MQCDCCGSDGIFELGEYRDYQHIRCKDCGYENFYRHNSTITADLYENDADYIDDLSVLTSSDDLVIWHHLEAVNFIKANFHADNAKTLDVGCFNGFFVKKLLSLGYDAYGVDFNKSAIAYGQENLGLGMRVSTQVLEELYAQDKRFDVVTVFEVLEHLPDVKAFLCGVTQLLSDGGVLVISTPNNKMCWRPALDYPPHHLSRFTMKSLQGHLSQLGMTVLHSAEQMSTYELIRHFVGTFFRSKNSTSLRGGEFKNKKLSTILRRGMNRLRKVLGVLFLPFDKLLYFFGIRYISQIVVAEKRR